MEAQTYGMFALGQGLLQGVLISWLWWLLYARTGHGAEWFLVALLPVSGLFVAPTIIVIAPMFVGSDSGWWIAMSLSDLTGFAFAASPLAILVWRIKKGYVRYDEL